MLMKRRVKVLKQPSQVLLEMLPSLTAQFKKSFVFLPNYFSASEDDNENPRMATVISLLSFYLKRQIACNDFSYFWSITVESSTLLYTQ